MVALAEQLIAAAGAHQLMAIFVKARGWVVSPESYDTDEQKKGDLGDQHSCAAWFHAPPPPAGTAASCSPTSSGATLRLRLCAMAALRLGVSAINVPKATIATPIQIHAISGFKKTLITGNPLSGFFPA